MVVVRFPIQATTLRQEAFRAIREDILSGRLLPGTKLVEAELAERLGVSRNPIREAIGRLEQQGLVVSIPNRGTYVAQLTPAQLKDGLLLRANLEIMAIRLAISHADPSRLSSLAEVVAGMFALAADDSLSDFEVCGRMNLLDAEFHQRLVECSGSEALQRTWDCVAPVDFVFLHDIETMLQDVDYRSRLLTVAEQHARLLEYLRHGDREGAESELKTQFKAPLRVNTCLEDEDLSLLS